MKEEVELEVLIMKRGGEKGIDDASKGNEEVETRKPVCGQYEERSLNLRRCLGNMIIDQIEKGTAGMCWCPRFVHHEVEHNPGGNGLCP